MKYSIPKENWISPKVEIRSAKIHGKGMFAKEKINVWETVVIWGGDNYTDKSWAKQAQKENKLIMQRDENIFSVETRGNDDAYFINHSCNGNLWMKDACTLIARIKINKDDEITADYALWEWDENKISKWKCRCNNIDCRKILTGKDYQLIEIQKKYLGHFSPLINKRIAKINHL